MEQIEPSHFYAVVVTSGLPELLIASALARAGKSVLILDACDSYGASWSSLSGSTFLHNILNQALEQQQRCSDTTSTSLHESPLSGTSGQSTTAASTVSQDPSAVHLQPLQPLQAVVGSVSIYRHPDVEELLAKKQLIVDLAPKVLYQDESLVQLLVACQAHNYIEFKLVEGSYYYSSGRLNPVPASRADLFADKSLSLADKRSLGRFLSACMEAQQGFGRLNDSFDSRPLRDVLAAEGLSQHLQQVVLYGIAMADTPQQLQQGAGVADPQAAESSGGSVSAQQAAQQVTAAEGLAALRLYTASLGRYGGTGAYMAPCYGCGSLPEAFVRLAAVKGATTALRHGAKRMVLLQPDQQKQPVQADNTPTPATADSKQAAVSSSSSIPQGPDQQEAIDTARVQVELTSGQVLTAHAVIGCRDCLPESMSDAAAGTGVECSSSSSRDLVVHAVALLDRSLVGEDNSLLLVFPPGSVSDQQTGVIRGVQFGPALAVSPAGTYLLYLSAVVPCTHYSTSSLCSSGEESSDDCGSCLAEQILQPAVEALASSKGLQAVMQDGNKEEAAEQDQTHLARHDTCQTTDMPHAQPSNDAEEQQQTTASESPQLLALCYYTTRNTNRHFTTLHQFQHKQQEEEMQGQSLTQSGLTPSSPVLLCPAASPGYAGYGSLVQDTETAFRQQFPDVPWLTDVVRHSRHRQYSRQAEAAGATGGQTEGAGTADVSPASTASVEDMDQPAGGQLEESAVFDDEGDAVDELTAALAELSAMGIVDQQPQQQ